MTGPAADNSGSLPSDGEDAAKTPLDPVAAAIGVLTAPHPGAKVRQTAWAVRQARAHGIAAGAPPRALPETPARPGRPLLVPPAQVPKRSLHTEAGRAALLHALAHIELNAVDLAWDMIGRFGPSLQSPDFYADWLQVAVEEALHFRLLQRRLSALGSGYGAFDAHDGLWQAARETADDLAARLAVVPLVLEARGLDVSPGMAGKLRHAGDLRSAAVLDRIYRDEIGHVRTGMTWFKAVCAQTGDAPIARYHDLIAARFPGRLKGPFNELGRNAAAFSPEFYAPLAR